MNTFGNVLIYFSITTIFLVACNRNETGNQNQMKDYYVTDKFYESKGEHGHLKLMLHKSSVDNESDFMELEFLTGAKLPDSVEIIQKKSSCDIKKDTALREQGYYYLVSDVDKLFDKNLSIYVRLYIKGKESKVLLTRKSKKRKKEFILH